MNDRTPRALSHTTTVYDSIAIRSRISLEEIKAVAGQTRVLIMNADWTLVDELSLYLETKRRD